MEVETNNDDDQSKLVKIEDFPDEVLIKIFNRLPLFSLREVGLVCPTWKRIIDKEIGYEITLSDVSEPTENDDNTNAFIQMSKVAIQICHVKLSTDTTCLPTLQYPSKLQVVDFKSPISALIYETFVTNATNLTQLKFGYSSLTGEDLSAISLQLPNLKLLSINDRSMDSSLFLQGTQFIGPNILGLLKQDFSSIQELYLSTIASQQHTKRFAWAVLKFLEKHFATIKIVIFNVDCTILRAQIQQQFNLAVETNLNAEFSGEDVAELNWDQLSKVQLKALELDFGRSYIVGLPQWQEFIRAQSALKSVSVFKGAPVSQDILKTIITNNFQHLSYIQIGVQIKNLEPASQNPIDCTIFEACTGLRKLSLTGNASGMLSRQIFNCQNLPKRILAFSLKNMCIESTEILKLVQRLDHIVKLTLDHVGTKHEYGFTLGMLDTIIKDGKCFEIIIKGFNGVGGEQFPELLKEFEIDTPGSLPHCNFHGKFSHELNQYVCICT